MKKRVLKNWVVELLMSLSTIAFMLIAITIDSTWTKGYVVFFLVNVAIISINTLILYKYTNIFKN